MIRENIKTTEAWSVPTYIHVFMKLNYQTGEYFDVNILYFNVS